MKLEKFEYINEIDKKNVNDFLKSINNRYLLGRNKWTNSILKNIKVDGIIDDFTNESEYKDIPIVKMKDIPKNSIVVSATMGGIQTAKRKLNNLKIINIDYFSFFKYSGMILESPPFIDDFKSDFSLNKSKYKKVYSLLADDTSKKIFEKVVNFKITFDLQYMQGFVNDMKLQYFEDNFFKVPSSAVFIDGGGIQVIHQ